MCGIRERNGKLLNGLSHSAANINNVNAYCTIFKTPIAIDCDEKAQIMALQILLTNLNTTIKEFIIDSSIVVSEVNEILNAVFDIKRYEIFQANFCELITNMVLENIDNL